MLRKKQFRPRPGITTMIDLSMFIFFIYFHLSFYCIDLFSFSFNHLMVVAPSSPLLLQGRCDDWKLLKRDFSHFTMSVLLQRVLCLSMLLTKRMKSFGVCFFFGPSWKKNTFFSDWIKWSSAPGRHGRLPVDGEQDPWETWGFQHGWWKIRHNTIKAGSLWPPIIHWFLPWTLNSLPKSFTSNYTLDFCWLITSCDNDFRGHTVQRVVHDPQSFQCSFFHSLCRVYACVFQPTGEFLSCPTGFQITSHLHFSWSMRFHLSWTVDHHGTSRRSGRSTSFRSRFSTFHSLKP